MVWIIWICSPETYPFIDALFKEYLEVRICQYSVVNGYMGTDEYCNETPNELVEKFREFTDQHYIRLVE